MATLGDISNKKSKHQVDPKLKQKQEKPKIAIDAGVTAPAIEKPSEGPILGAYEDFSVSAAKEPLEFIKSSMNQAGNIEVKSYQRQVVNGWNHKLELVCCGKQKTVIVYESPEHKFSIASAV